MKKALFNFVLFACLSSPSIGQQLTNLGPWDIYYASNLCFGKEDRVFVSSNGGLYFTDNFGTSWSKVKAPFNTIYFESPLIRTQDGDVYIWLDQMIYHSVDNGVTWVGQILITPNLGKISALAVYDQNIFVGTDKGLFYYSSSEFLVDASEVFEFSGLYISDIKVSEDRVVVATKNNGVYVSMDNTGKTWKHTTVGFPTNFEAVCLEIYGDKIFVGSRWNGVFYSENAGENWNTKNNGFTSLSITDLYIDNDKIYVTKDSYTNIYSSSIDGSSWGLIDNGIDNNYSPQAILARGDTLLVGAWHNVLRSINSGASWQSKVDGITAAFDFTSIESSANGDLFAFATHTGLYRKRPSDAVFYPFIKTTGGRIGKGLIYNNRVPLIDAFVIKFYNTVTGILEEQISTSNMIFADILVSTERGFFLSTLLDGIYHYTQNNAWEAYNHNLISTEVNDLILADSILYAATRNGLFKSDINNDDWKKIETGQIEPDVRNIYSRDSIFIVSTFNYSYRSSDYGLTWSNISSLDNREIKDVLWYNNRLYASNYSLIYYSDDLGKTWSSSSEYPGLFFGAMAIQNDSLYISAMEEGIFSTKINQQQIIEFELPESHILKNTPAFAVTASASSGLPVSFTSSNGNIIKMVGDQINIVGSGEADIVASQAGNINYLPAARVVQSIIVEELITAAEKVEKQSFSIYSNPGNGYYTIKVNEDLLMANYSFDVLDPLGKLIEYEIKPVGENSFILDIHESPNGIYILNFRNKSYVTSARFVKR